MTRWGQEPKSELMLSESGDWAWLGVHLDPGERQWARCPVHIFQASADGIMFLTDRNIYLGYAMVAKQYPLDRVDGFAVDPADYGEVALSVSLPEGNALTHLRPLDEPAFARFFPTTVALLRATRSAAARKDERLRHAREQVVDEVRGFFDETLEQDEQWIANEFLASTTGTARGSAEMWAVTSHRVLRRSAEGVHSYRLQSARAFSVPGSGQHQYAFLSTDHTGARVTVHLEPLVSPFGPDDRWWEFFEVLVDRAARAQGVPPS